MTKEQALQNELTGTTAEVDTYPNILRAMDAHARQEAIEYAKFVYEDCDRLSDNTWACRITSWREEYTSDQLYDLYLTYIKR